ncbi:MAG: D-alanyl-D-alanine carboxypeptidase [Hyphomicrobiales bacterium]|nr:D-alanyl-D-alanine carboxypeptidase [Hyphomicrobiales bacterium]
MSGRRLSMVAVCLVSVAATFFVATISDAEAARRRYKSTSANYTPLQSSVVIDQHSGQIIQSYKADEARFPASITKVMTLYIVFRHLRQGRIALTTPLMVTEHAASQPPTKLHLKAGGSITVHDAMRALVTKSANDAAVAVAENLAGSEAAFAKLMTAEARRLGMKNTTFRNASGLPDAGQRTTAYDLAVLGRAVLRDFPEHANLFKLRYFKYGGKLYKNHNGLLFTYKGADGMKTGFTNASGFNLLSTAQRDDKAVIAVVLGGRSSRQRNQSMRALLDASWSRAKTRAEHEAERAVARAAERKRIAEAAKQLAQRAAPPRERLAVAAAAPARPQPSHLMALRPLEAPRSGTDATASQLSASRPAPAPHAVAPADDRKLYHVQVGAYDNQESAERRLLAVSREAGDIVTGRSRLIVSGLSHGRPVARARFGAYSKAAASDACDALRRRAIDCIVVEDAVLTRAGAGEEGLSRR